MIAQTLRAALLALLSFLPTATANHFTCNWGGPGNDPAAHGWNYFCTGYQSNQDGFTCDYICELTFRYAYVATFGKIDHADGIIEFNTACNKNGFAPENFCGPSFWGICLGDKAPYSKCWYQQSYDDCQFPEWINRTHMAEKVTIYYIGHSMVDKPLAASVPRRTALDDAKDHQARAQSLIVDDLSPSPPQGTVISVSTPQRVSTSEKMRERVSGARALQSLPSERPTRARDGIKASAGHASSSVATSSMPLPQQTQADAANTSPIPPQRGEADVAVAPRTLRVKARSLGSKASAVREADGGKAKAPRTTAPSAWVKVSNALRAFTGGELLEEDEGIVNQENEKGR